GRGIRVLDLERCTDQVVDEVDLSPGHVHDRHRVDQHLGTVALDDQVIRLALGNEVEFVLKPGAAAAFHAHAQQLVPGFAGRNLADAAGGAFGEGDAVFSHGALGIDP